MIKKLSLYTVALLGAVVFFGSCTKEYETPQTIDDRTIADYLSKNNVAATPDSSKTGYFYTVTNPSTSGDLYKTSDSVRYNVTLKSLTNSAVYSASPTYSNLGNVVGYSASTFAAKQIIAIREVMTKLKPGGTARIFLPSYLAFGKNGNTALGVPSNEVLELDITTYTQKQSELDDQHIQTFLTANSSLKPTKDASGVYYIVNQVGTGTDPIGLNTDIKVTYTGRRLDGSQFDANTDGFTTTLKGVIQGWAILGKFTKGAKLRIFVPSVLAYGNTGNTGIGANNCLDFDIEITDVIL